MSPDDFHVARCMEEDGWEYCGLDESGDMFFTRIYLGAVYSATVKLDR